MKPAERRDKIVKLVDRLGEVHVDALAQRFGSSRETIRRDLGALDGAGRVRKFHGGARRIPDPSEPPDTLTAEKDAIGHRAAALFDEGAVIVIDGGSTSVALARALAQRQGLTIITNSLQIAGLMAAPDRRHRLYLLGGEIDPEGRRTLGALAVQQLQQFKAQHAVLSVGAMTRGEIMGYDLRETELARAMIARAATVTVLADHSKLDRAAVFELAPLTRVDRLVTDRAPPPDLADALRAAGVKVILAPPP